DRASWARSSASSRSPHNEREKARKNGISSSSSLRNSLSGSAVEVALVALSEGSLTRWRPSCCLCLHRSALEVRGNRREQVPGRPHRTSYGVLGRARVGAPVPQPLFPYRAGLSPQRPRAHFAKPARPGIARSCLIPNLPRVTSVLCKPLLER